MNDDDDPEGAYLKVLDPPSVRRAELVLGADVRREAVESIWRSVQRVRARRGPTTATMMLLQVLEQFEHIVLERAAELYVYRQQRREADGAPTLDAEHARLVERIEQAVAGLDWLRAKSLEI